MQQTLCLLTHKAAGAFRYWSHHQYEYNPAVVHDEQVFTPHLRASITSSIALSSKKG